MNRHSKEAIRRDNAKRAAAKRAWENEHDRGTCACGQPMAVGARRKGYVLCRSCRHAARRAERIARAQLISERWAAGLSLAELAREIGMSETSLGVEMLHIRRNGWADRGLPRCGSCKGFVQWVVTAEGRRIALDLGAKSSGSVWVNPDTGRAHFLSKERQERGRAAGVELRVPHRCGTADDRVAAGQTALDLDGAA